MSWFTNALRSHLGGAECESFDECLRRLREGSGAVVPPTAERVAQLEEDLARAVLLIHTLVEACVRKGVFTREEIARAAAEIDLFDGVADGKLDPATIRHRQV